MVRINATEAARKFDDLLQRVSEGRESFELHRGERVVARLVPPGEPTLFRAADLRKLFSALPDLGSDAERFAEDLKAIRRDAPPEPDPWG
jgi:antitoxin (DNA-binding transcriptional repressor) of toxin-antitoxin stability system